MAQQYWKPDEMWRSNCRWNFIVGKRSCGKTYALMRLLILCYFKKGQEFAYIRRAKESLSRSKVVGLFKPHYDVILKHTDGKYNSVDVTDKVVTLVYRDEDGHIISRCDKPICVCFSLSTQDNDKGADMCPNAVSAIVDEAIARGGYLKDEWTILNNCFSTIFRSRWEDTEINCRVFFLANPISKVCPIMDALGIPPEFLDKSGRFAQMINYDGTNIKTWFEYLPDSENLGELDPNSIKSFYTLQNSKIQSITSGCWELEDSPRLPDGVQKLSQLRKEGYMYYRGKVYRWAVYVHKSVLYCVWSPSVKWLERAKQDRMMSDAEYSSIITDMLEQEKKWFFTLYTVPCKYAIIGFNNQNAITKLIAKCYKNRQVYYSDNFTADAIRGFQKESKQMIT